MTCKDNYDGSCSVDYIPTEVGDYDVSIKFADKHIPGSPFKVQVEEEIDNKGVRAYGPGLEPEMVREGVPAKFIVDTSMAKMSKLDVKLKADRGHQIQKPEIKHRGEGVYEVTYQPPPAGTNLQIDVNYGNEKVKGSPYNIKVLPLCEPEKVVMSGPGVSPVVTASFPTDFVVDTSKAGYGDLEVQVLVRMNNVLSIKSY